MPPKLPWKLRRKGDKAPPELVVPGSKLDEERTEASARAAGDAAAAGNGDAAPGSGDAPGGEAGAVDPTAAAAALLAGPQAADRDTKELLRNLKKQQKARMEQKLAEAKELEQRAKDLAKRVRAEEKLREESLKHSEHVAHIASQLGIDPHRPVTEIPALEDPNLVQTEFTPILDGISYVRIVYNTESNRYHYEVIEPRLTQTEKEVLEFIRDTLVRTLDGRQNGDQDWERVLVEAVERIIVDHSIIVDEVSKKRLEYYLVRDFLGYGPIDVLMHDPMIEDISCDGPGIPVYLFHRQYESLRTTVQFEEEHALDSFVIRLAQRSGKHISIAEPLLDATLPDTSRLQASLSREVTTRGSTFTIRKFRGDPLTPPDLVRLGTMSPPMAAFFWFVMQEGSSLIYAGGTASGKTTTLNAVCQFIPPQKKVVSIEDTREINLQHENWIPGLTRGGFGGEMVKGKPAGAIDMYKLLEAALRQRPEYLLVGEVRGPEALTLFQAMATGHATYSTLHADSVMSAVYRLENPPINIPRIMLQTLDAMAVQVQARMNQRMVRRIKEVVEVVGIDPETGDLLTNTVFQWDSRTDTHQYLGKSRILEHLMEKNNMSAQEMEQELANRVQVIEWMVRKGIRHINDVSNVISAYYRTPQVVLEKARRSAASAPRALAPGAVAGGAGSSSGEADRGEADGGEADSQEAGNGEAGSGGADDAPQ